eukprot:366145-Chlamydomonas_euryale.AAC.1
MSTPGISPAGSPTRSAAAAARARRMAPWQDVGPSAAGAASPPAFDRVAGSLSHRPPTPIGGSQDVARVGRHLSPARARHASRLGMPPVGASPPRAHGFGGGGGFGGGSGFGGSVGFGDGEDLSSVLFDTPTSSALQLDRLSSGASASSGLGGRTAGAGAAPGAALPTAGSGQLSGMVGGDKWGGGSGTGGSLGGGSMAVSGGMYCSMPRGSSFTGERTDGAGLPIGSPSPPGGLVLSGRRRSSNLGVEASVLSCSGGSSPIRIDSAASGGGSGGGASPSSPRRGAISRGVSMTGAAVDPLGASGSLCTIGGPGPMSSGGADALMSFMYKF